MDVSGPATGTQQDSEGPPPPPELEPYSASTAAIPAGPFSLKRQPIPGSSFADLLTNRFILGGLGAVAILLLTAIVLIAIGHGDDVGDGGSNNVVAPRDNEDEETPGRPIGGLVGTTVTTASYRNGPGPTYVILGTIPRGATVAIVGRSEDETWLQVRYPSTSNLKGWVDAKLLDFDGDVSVLAIAGPGPVANAGVTSIPTVAVYEPVETPTEDLVETAGPRPTRTPSRPTVTPYRTAAPTPTDGPLPTEPLATQTVTQ